MWLVYPALRLIEIHSRAGSRDVTEPSPLVERDLFGDREFSLSPSDLFDENPEV